MKVGVNCGTPWKSQGVRESSICARDGFARKQFGDHSFKTMSEKCEKSVLLNKSSMSC